MVESFLLIEEAKEIPESYEEEVNFKKITLKKKTQKEKLIIFDLDETLTHCTLNDSPDQWENSEIIITIPGKKQKAPINIWKSAWECLREAGKHFEVVVFTASVKDYADAILDFLDPEDSLIHHRFYRDSCIQRVFPQGEKFYVKDLRIFENFDLKDIVIVDNAVYSFIN